jgi:hypothetical protein
VSLRLTTASKIVKLEELNAELGLIKEAEQKQRGIVETIASELPSTEILFVNLMLMMH